MKKVPAHHVSNLLVITLLFFLAGCGPRAEVAKDKVLTQIDKLLGETEVQKKQVESSVHDLRNAVDALAEGKNRARVQAELYGQQVEERQRKIGELEGYLKTLREQLQNAAAMPVVLAGKNYTQDDLKALADKVIQAHKTATKELESMKRSQANLDRAASSLEERHRQAKARLADLEDRHREFQAKVDELKVLREAREKAGDADTTLAARFEALERQMDELQVSTEAALRTEQERWKALDPKSDLAEVEEIANAGKGTDGTIAEIDKILGKK